MASRNAVKRPGLKCKLAIWELIEYGNRGSNGLQKPVIPIEFVWLDHW